MRFGEAISHVYSHYAQFEGRARRSEYWYFHLFLALVSAAVSILESVFSKSAGIQSAINTAYGFFTLGSLIPTIAVGCRRLHDIGKSGWYQLLSLIPLVGTIILLVWDCQDSQPGPNLYGEYPKATNFFDQRA